MAKVFSFYGRDIFDPGVYSKILTVGAAAPTPSGTNALCIIAEASNGPVFGELVAVASVSDAKLIFGDQGPAIEAVFGALNSSPSLSSAQDVRVFNPRDLDQAIETIKTIAAGADAIDADLLRSQFPGQVASKSHHAPLMERVVRRTVLVLHVVREVAEVKHHRASHQ